MITKLHEKFKKNILEKRKYRNFRDAGLVGSIMVGALAISVGIATFKSVVSISANPIVQEKIKLWNKPYGAGENLESRSRE